MNFRSKLSLGALLAGAVAAGAWAAPLQAQVDTTQRDTSGYRASQNDTSNAAISATGQSVTVILRSRSGMVIDTLQGHQTSPGVVVVETSGRNRMMRRGDKGRINDTTRMRRRSTERMNADSSRMHRDSSRTGQSGIQSDTSGVRTTMPPLKPGTGGRLPGKVDSLQQMTHDSTPANATGNSSSDSTSSTSP